MCEVGQGDTDYPVGRCFRCHDPECAPQLDLGGKIANTAGTECHALYIAPITVHTGFSRKTPSHTNSAAALIACFDCGGMLYVDTDRSSIINTSMRLEVIIPLSTSNLSLPTRINTTAEI